MKTLKSILAWERSVFIFSLAITVALITVTVGAIALGSIFGSIIDIKNLEDKVGVAFFVGIFVGWFVIGTALVLLSHLVGLGLNLFRKTRHES